MNLPIYSVLLQQPKALMHQSNPSHVKEPDATPRTLMLPLVFKFLGFVVSRKILIHHAEDKP